MDLIRANIWIGIQTTQYNNTTPFGSCSTAYCCCCSGLPSCSFCCGLHQLLCCCCCRTGAGQMYVAPYNALAQQRDNGATIRMAQPVLTTVQMRQTEDYTQNQLIEDTKRSLRNFLQEIAFCLLYGTRALDIFNIKGTVAREKLLN